MKIKTKHPQGKRGVNIVQEKYDTIKFAIEACLKSKNPLTHTELTQAIESKLTGHFQGSIAWYIEVVKLDLEARNILKRDTSVKPARYQWTQLP